MTARPLTGALCALTVAAAAAGCGGASQRTTSAAAVNPMPAAANTTGAQSSTTNAAASRKSARRAAAAKRRAAHRAKEATAGASRRRAAEARRKAARAKRAAARRHGTTARTTHHASRSGHAATPAHHQTGHAKNKSSSGGSVAAGPVIRMGRTPAGTVLVDAARRTLYTFSPDAARHATCRGSCAAVWPPLLVGVGVKPRAGSGVRAGLLGTDPYAGGRRIVTYAGWPLYTFAGDSRRGTASGQGLNANGGRWFVIRASGARVKKR